MANEKPVLAKEKAPRTANMKSKNLGMGGARHPAPNLAEIAVGNVSKQRMAKWGSPRKKNP